MTANAARNDQLKVIQIGGDIECEPVHRHPARDANAYRRELFIAYPNAHEIASTRFRLYSEIARRADQHFLNVAHIAANVLTPGQQFNNRIADQLTWAVISHVTAATGFKKLDS